MKGVRCLIFLLVLLSTSNGAQHLLDVGISGNSQIFEFTDEDGPDGLLAAATTFVNENNLESGLGCSNDSICLVSRLCHLMKNVTGISSPNPYLDLLHSSLVGNHSFDFFSNDFNIYLSGREAPHSAIQGPC